ncbi:MAG TPA: serine hydrolase domain-containing protein [Acidimicrobiales bacterium]|nr:serine hydrolase domain-containing protein [Acidimicrobiales bacterium]
MATLDSYRSRLDHLLRELAADLGIPGAACGVLLDGDAHVASWGVANVATGAAVLPGTLFQIGSITKVYTATLVMQAVHAGVVALDEPVRAQLQEFSVADPGATIEITPRHLLTHTSGIEGDHLVDTGWNADALGRYVATLAGLGQLHPPDEAYSFCNTGYGVLGRLLEAATGDDFDRVLRRRLTRPLGCRATVTLPQHALLHSVAVGHRHTVEEPPSRQPRWTLTRANGPMGGVVAPAAELLALARLHLDHGRGPSGEELLAPVAVEDMQRLHADTPIPGEAQALGWTVRPWGTLTSLGLDADTFGQRAALRLVPERRFALCVLANSPRGGVLAQALMGHVAADLLDVTAPDPSDPVGDSPAAATAADLGAAGGTYERLHQRVTVAVEDGRLHLRTEPSGVLQALGLGPTVLGVEPTGRAGPSLTAMGTDPATGQREVVVVLLPTGATQPGALYLGGRLHRRVT